MISAWTARIYPPDARRESSKPDADKTSSTVSGPDISWLASFGGPSWRQIAQHFDRHFAKVPNAGWSGDQ